MSITTIILLSLVGWLGVSIAYLWCNLGNKHGSDPWYAWVLGAPVMLLIIVICAPRDLKEWWYLHYPYAPSRIMRGRPSNIELTWGRGGNQWTTIDHGRDRIVYATFFDALTRDWEIGEVVEFEAYWDNLHIGANRYKRVLHARNIKSAYKMDPCIR